jgi:hypothetical protein
MVLIQDLEHRRCRLMAAPGKVNAAQARDLYDGNELSRTLATLR